jgi:hypothetical protein
MLPNRQSIETAAGKIVLGATVRSTRYAGVQGLVTAIFWSGYTYSIQVDNRHSDEASKYELLSTPPRTQADVNAQNLNPFYQFATSGDFEILLPGEGERIYFADTAAQAIALVAAAIGIHDQEHEVKYLTDAAAAGPVDELRWRGCTVPSSVGQLAYISTRKERPAPKFKLNDQVRLERSGTDRTVSGLALYKDRLNYGKTKWHYIYAGGPWLAQPLGEEYLQAIPAPEVPAPEPAPAEAPAAPAAHPKLSYAAEIIVSSQLTTVKAVEHQMKVKPRRAKKLFEEMQERYGDKPTLLHLAMFSGASDLVAMIAELRQVGALTS